MDCHNIPWDKLSRSARMALLKIAYRLGDDAFTGQIRLDCNQGGVGSMSEEVVVDRREDGSRRIHVDTYRPGERG